MLVNMTRTSARVLIALCAVAGAGGCREQAPAPTPESSEAPAASAPGELPLRRPTSIEAKLLPPRAVIGADPDARSPVLSFDVVEEPDRLFGWFRATGNGADFVLESEMQEGEEHVFSGRVRATGEAYAVRVAPGANGGTTGSIMVTPR